METQRAEEHADPSAKSKKDRIVGRRSPAEPLVLASPEVDHQAYVPAHLAHRTASSAASPVPPATDGFATLKHLNVHICGRLEAVRCDALTLQGLSDAMERQFEIRPPFILLDAQGCTIESDTDIAHASESNSTLYLKMTEGVLHDFERRIDHFRHMQWGYLRDEVSQVQHLYQAMKLELKNAWLLLEQEQSSRETGDQEFRREIEDARQLIRQERSLREQQLGGVGEAINELRASVTQEGEIQRRAATATRREIEKMSVDIEALDGERITAQVQVQELADRFTSIRAKIDDEEEQFRRLQEAHEELKAQMVVEQRDRISADADLAHFQKDLKQAFNQEKKDRVVEHSLIEGQLRDLQQRSALTVDTIEEEQAFRSAEDQSIRDNIEALKISVDNEKKTQDAVGVNITSLARDLLKKLDEEAHLRDLEIQKISRVSASESEERVAVVAKLHRAVALVQENVIDEAEIRGRELKELYAATEEARNAVKVEQKNRIQAFEELNERHMQIRRLLGDEQKKRSTEIMQMDQKVRDCMHLTDGARNTRASAGVGVIDKVDELQRAMEGAVESEIADRHMAIQGLTEKTRELESAIFTEQRERTMADSDLASTLKDVRQTVENHARVRESGNSTMSRSLAEFENSLAREQKSRELLDHRLTGAVEALQGTVHGLQQWVADEAENADKNLRMAGTKARDEAIGVIARQLGDLADNVRKAQDAITNEQRARAEGLQKLREDCKDAVAKEVRARIDREATLTEDLERNAKVQVDAIENLERAIEDLRDSLETHTHELHVGNVDMHAEHARESSHFHERLMPT